MDKEEVLRNIFNDDPDGLLDVKAKQSNARTPDERLSAAFKEIKDFVTEHGREPEPNPASVSEFQLYSRLKGLREDEKKAELLSELDEEGLLKTGNQVNEPAAEYGKPKKEMNSVEDILGDDDLDLLGSDDAGLFDFKHAPRPDERASADFVARRKPCKDFDEFEEAFKAVQHDLAEGSRKLVSFKQENLRKGDFYVHNGILLLLEHVEFEEEEQNFKSGKRVRIDGRTRTIFENGTESAMKYRSLYKALLDNGKSITQNTEEVNEEFIEQFSSITLEDEEAGYIYVLRSKSTDEKIRSIKNLYKIGYATDVESRLKGADKQPTYLMAPVDYVAGWKCYNMNPQKFEQMIHNFFGSSCLEVDVFDEKGKRHTPREWFIAPLEVIEQAIELIINGKVVKYRYDAENKNIIER